MTNDTRKPRRKDQNPLYKLQMILQKTNKVGECLEWTGNYFRKYKPGLEWWSYPYMYFKNKVWRGNRLVLFLITSINPKDKYALHTCDNNKCVNPDHLYWGTHADNIKDMVSKKRNHTKRTKRGAYATKG